MIGDQNDMVGRLQRWLPRTWFGDSNPILNGLLNGFAYALSLGYGLLAYTRLQTRLMTATDGWLDLASYDFFGLTLPRRGGELDSAFRARILSSLFRPRATRAGMIQTLQTLTGRAPAIFEPARMADTGAYDTGTLGYDSAGGYGAFNLNYQCFVTAFRPVGAGIPNVAGYDTAPAGYDMASLAEWTDLSQVQGAVLDSDIAAAADAAKVAGTNINFQISS